MDTLLEYGLVAVFIALVLTAVGLPIPEDVSLAVAGVLARTGPASWVDAWIVGYIGVLTGDLIVYHLGKRVGLHPKGWLGRLFGDKQIDRILRFYRRFGDYSVVVCRQPPGMRFPAFFFSGATGMPLSRFLLLDGLAAVFTVSIWVSVSWWLGERLGDFKTLLGSVRWGLTSLGVLLFAAAIWTVLRSRKKRAGANKSPP